MLKNQRSQRRPERDVEFGYESDHLICVIPPHLEPSGWAKRHDMPSTFELQIRTLLMHAYAEPQHDIGYKAARDLPHQIRRELCVRLATAAWGADQAYEHVRKWNEGRPTGDSSGLESHWLLTRWVLGVTTSTSSSAKAPGGTLSWN